MSPEEGNTGLKLTNDFGPDSEQMLVSVDPNSIPENNIPPVLNLENQGSNPDDVALEPHIVAVVGGDSSPLHDEQHGLPLDV